MPLPSPPELRSSRATELPLTHAERREVPPSLEHLRCTLRGLIDWVFYLDRTEVVPGLWRQYAPLLLAQTLLWQRLRQDTRPTETPLSLPASELAPASWLQDSLNWTQRRMTQQWQQHMAF